MTEPSSAATSSGTPSAPAQPGAAEAPAPELRAKLGTVLSDPQLAPLPEPASPGLTEDAVGELWREYQAAPTDQQAFGVLLRRSVGVAKDTMSAEAVRRENVARASRALSSLNAEITATVKREAPDVDVDLFWAYGARLAERECPASITDPLAALAWQTRRAIELVRAKTGARPGQPAAGGAGASPQTGTSANRQGGRTMADLISARQQRFLGRR